MTWSVRGKLTLTPNIFDWLRGGMGRTLNLLLQHEGWQAHWNTIIYTKVFTDEHVLSLLSMETKEVCNPTIIFILSAFAYNMS